MNEEFDKKLEDLRKEISGEIFSQFSNLESRVNEIEQRSGQDNIDQSVFNTSDVFTKNAILNIINDKNSETILNVSANNFIINPETRLITFNNSSPYTSSTSEAIQNGMFLGQLLILIGSDDINTITIKDLANTNMNGDAVLKQYDTLTLVWTGDLWTEISRYIS